MSQVLQNIIGLIAMDNIIAIVWGLEITPAALATTIVALIAEGVTCDIQFVQTHPVPATTG